MKNQKKQIYAPRFIAEGKKIEIITAKIKGSEYSIEDVHDSKWQYDISYMVNGIDYSGVTEQYIHWAPPFVMNYFNNLYKEGGEVKIRVSASDPEEYDADMDYAIAMDLGPCYSGNDESDRIDIQEVKEVPKCVEVKIKGEFYDESHFTKLFFKVLADGYEKFIFNITEVTRQGYKIVGAIGWAQRYARAFTCDNKYALLKKPDQDDMIGICRIISDSKDEIIDKFVANYRTSQEIKAEEHEKLSDIEKEISEKKEIRKLYGEYKNADEFADFMMKMMPITGFDKETLAEFRMILESKETLTNEEEEAKKNMEYFESIDIEEEKEKMRISLVAQWNEVMNWNDDKKGNN